MGNSPSPHLILEYICSLKAHGNGLPWIVYLYQGNSFSKPVFPQTKIPPRETVEGILASLVTALNTNYLIMVIFKQRNYLDGRGRGEGNEGDQKLKNKKG